MKKLRIPTVVGWLLLLPGTTGIGEVVKAKKSGFQ
jgi:hypothetical protein